MKKTKTLGLLTSISIITPVAMVISCTDMSDYDKFTPIKTSQHMSNGKLTGEIKTISFFKESIKLVDKVNGFYRLHVEVENNKRVIYYVDKSDNGWVSDVFFGHSK